MCVGIHADFYFEYNVLYEKFVRSGVALRNKYENVLFHTTARYVTCYIKKMIKNNTVFILC